MANPHTFSAKKDSAYAFTDFESEFPTYYKAYKGEDVNMPVLDDYPGNRDGQAEKKIDAATRLIKSSTASEAPVYWPLCAALTCASLDITPSNQTDVLTFIPHNASVMKVAEGADEKPDFVAFFGSRQIANTVVGYAMLGDAGFTMLDEQRRSLTAYQIIAPGEVKRDSGDEGLLQCRRYMFSVARHRPASSVQYGIFATPKEFQLLALGLRAQRLWPKVLWSSESYIKKLYSCVSLIKDEALTPRCPAVPMWKEVGQEKEKVPIGVFTANVGNKVWDILQIWTGRANGRRQFVALAQASNDKEEVRVFKYTWNDVDQHCREKAFLEKLQDAPGVVTIDKELSLDTVQEDAWSGRKRSLLVLKTVGHSLCSCSSVLEFLEAMYDLLEVLRYTVQEKKVLHRDISWANVLIQPMSTHDVKKHFPEEPTKESIPHNYRFISDIFQEQRRIRVALADFDVAADLDSVSPDNLKGATGTPMFMANDVLFASTKREMRQIEPDTVKDLKTSILQQDMKYLEPTEKQKWDGFHSQLHNVRYTKQSFPNKSFRHGAVHDAESVFCLCLLFFNRLWPRGVGINSDEELEKLEESRGDAFALLASKQIGKSGTRAFRNGLLEGGFYEPYYDMLNAINEYLTIPWYNVPDTGRGEPYEFHLHDIMQRIILAKICEVRQKGSAPIPILNYPIRVRTSTARGNTYTSCSQDLLSTKRTIDTVKEQKEEGEKGIRYPIAKVGFPVKAPTCISTFEGQCWTVFRWKKIERAWLVSDKL